MNFNKNITVLAAIMGTLTIIIGAFGAHGLKEIVSEKTITSFETGVRYQMYHVIVILIIGFSAFIDQKTQKWVSRFFMVGILLFSGSIYLIVMKDIFFINTKILSIATPIGGLFLIIGWLRLTYGIIVNK
ncbi:MAG: DUF423 domain-containing protein [Flavobacteriales bacterium]|nr:MAG: DUF423 domain-containing protein [Flavobacteriales bacterium]